MLRIDTKPAAVIVLVVALVTTSWAQAPASNAPPADLDAYVAASMKTFDVPGMAVAIVKDGKILVAKGYGVRKLGDPTPVDEFTMFGIGSNTKAFTTAALATLVDEGKLSWDDPVYQRLPGFVMYDPYVSHEMTIRDLLTHRSGMGLGEGDLLFWPHSTYTREDVIYKLRFMKPHSSFRSHYAYDNLLYMTAGQIIPAVTGTSWDDYIRQRIFTPLGMNHSNVSNALFKPGDDYAYPHSAVDGKLQVIPFGLLDNAGPAGSINSCAADMAKWVQLQLNRGKFADRDGHLFTEERSKEMWSPQTILPTNDPPPPLSAIKANFADYALGWGLRDYHGRKLIGHTGGVGGFVSRVMLVPEENLGVVVLTNAEEDGAFDSILYHVLDYYFHLPSIGLDRELQNPERQRGERRRRDHEEGRGLARHQLQTIPSPRKICGSLQRRMVRPHHHPRGKRRARHHLRPHARHGRRPATLAVRHLQGSLAGAHHRGCLRHLLAESGWNHRQRQNGRRIAAGRLQLRLSGSTAEARSGGTGKKVRGSATSLSLHARGRDGRRFWIVWAYP